MANIKSAETRIRQTAKRQARNKGVRSRLRSTLKSHRAAEPAEQAKKVPEAYSEIDVARKKGVIHKTAAARLKSRLARKASAKA